MTDPFLIDSPTCLSVSGGKTSAYMFHRVLEANGGLPHGSRALFCNTGKEEEATLRFIRDLSERWSTPITWLEFVVGKEWRVVDFDSASRNGEPFEDVIRQRGGILPNRVARFCSSEMKTRTMHRYLRAQGWSEWDTFIGIRADEPRRVVKFRANPHPEGKHEEVHMPLVPAGISSKHVAAFWREQPFDLELPTINGKTMHGNCDLCFLKPNAQLLSLIVEKPERATWWAAQEVIAEKSATSTAARFRADLPSYAQMRKFAEEQRDMFDPNEEAIPCFCGD